MDIERLKELKGITEQLYQDGNVPLTCCDDVLETINEAIARQSVKSGEVAEAINEFESAFDGEVIVNGLVGVVSEYQFKVETIDLAITALQAYQPWISVDDRLPEKPQYDWVLVHITLSPDGFVGLPHVAELRRGKWFSTEYDLPIEQILQGTVTHWKPLPEPPTEEGETK